MTYDPKTAAELVASTVASKLSDAIEAIDSVPALRGFGGGAHRVVAFRFIPKDAVDPYVFTNEHAIPAADALIADWADHRITNFVWPELTPDDQSGQWVDREEGRARVRVHYSDSGNDTYEIRVEVKFQNP